MTRAPLFRLRARYLPLGDYEVHCVGTYEADGSPALEVWSQAGELLLRVTVCLEPHATPETGNVVIKDWSENAGILDALGAAEIVELPPVRTHKTRFVEAFECRLLPAGVDIIRRSQPGYSANQEETKE